MISTLALFVACGGGDDGGGAAEITISATQGGTLESADGRFKLEIPAGAVSSETIVSVAVAGPDDLPAAAGIDDAVFVYQLAPEGLAFAIPATGTITLDAEAAVGDVYSLPDIAHVSAEGAAEPLDDLSVIADPGVATVATFALSSFSYVVTQGVGSRGTVAGPASATGVVGVPFSLSLTSTWTKPAGIPGASAFSANPVAGLTDCGDFFDGEIVPGQPYFGEATLVCLDVGEARPQVSATAVRRSGGGTECSYIGYRPTIRCQANPAPLDVPGHQTLGDLDIVMTLVLGGKLYPRDQFSWSPPDMCEGNHWHSPNTVFPIGTLNGSFVSLDLNDQTGIVDEAPMGCGFGEVDQVPQRAVVLTSADWAEFLANH